jgi:predicted Zn-dependent protease
MQKRTLPIALGTLLCALFTANSVQASSLPYNRLQGQQSNTVAYAEPQAYGTGSASNYVSDVTGMGRIVWPLDKMPLKVYIEDGTGTPGYRDYYLDMMRKAFSEWQEKTNGKVSWQEVGSPQQANITCTWTSVAKPNGPGVEAGETKSTVGINRFTGEQVIMRATISVLTSLMGRNFSDTDTYKTCLHEVGHAIGMEGHSENPGDIMYAVLNDAQTPYLKDRDINTISALYSEATRHLAQAPGFQPQGAGNYGASQFRQARLQPRVFSQPWQGRQIDSDNQVPPVAFAPRGRYQRVPLNMSGLSYEQREALLRAIQENMRQRQYAY